MPIVVNCQCGKQMRAPDEYAGKKIKCNSCGATQVVPAPRNGAAAKPAAAPESAAAVVRFDCDGCGQAMQARSEFAGRQTKCPSCQAVMTIPASDEAAVTAEVAEEEERPKARIQSGRPLPNKKAGKRLLDEDEVVEAEVAGEDEDDRPRKRSRRDEDEDADERPNKRSRRDEEEEEEDRPRKRRKSRQGMGLGLTIGLAIGVLLLLGGAVTGVVLLMSGSGGGSVSDLAMIPGDAQLFAVVHFADVWKQPAVQDAMAQAKKLTGEDVAGSIEKNLGMPPADIERATVVFLTAPTGNPMTERAWVVVTTNKPIDRARSATQLDLDPIELKHNGKSYQKSKKTQELFHFASSRVYFSAPNEESMKTALEQLTGTRKAAPGKLASLTSMAAGKQHLIVGLVVPPDKIQEARAGLAMLPPGVNLAPMLEVQTGAMTINLTGPTTQLDVTLAYPDPGKAKEAKTAIETSKVLMGVGLAATLPAAAAEVQKVLNNLTIEAVGADVKLKTNFEFKAEMFTQLAQIGAAGAGPQPGGRPRPRPNPPPIPNPNPIPNPIPNPDFNPNPNPNPNPVNPTRFSRPKPAAAPTSYLKAVSSPGDFIGQGKTYSYQGNELQVKSTPRSITVTVDGWRINFAPPRGGALQPGEYLNAKRFPFNDNSPGLNFSGQGRGSNRVGGEFVIWELEMNGGQVVRLAIDFVHRSEETGPPLTGSLRYNSTLE